MKYSGKTASGDAGEFFFAYQVASVLGWPCRLFDIDIGIDAQVEVLDEDGKSAGNFVAFQVKTTSGEGSAAYRHVRKRQLASLGHSRLCCARRSAASGNVPSSSHCKRKLRTYKEGLCPHYFCHREG